MVIQWYGQACFKITSGDLVIAIDPFSKDIGLTAPRFRADIVLVTHEHFDHSNVESISAASSGHRSEERASPSEAGREGAFVISGPGEYEVKGVYIQGLRTFHDKAQGKERGTNTIYKIEFEDLSILHLGDFGEGELREEVQSEIGDIDILLIPVGGKYTIDADEAARVMKQIEPRIAIPMHYKIPGLKVGLDGVEQFLKEVGASKNQAQEKLVIKKKDMGEEEKTEVVVLKPV